MLEKYVVTHNFIPKALAKNCFPRVVNLCKNTTALQSTRFTHERSFNEDCILHVRIPFFNWINVFFWVSVKPGTPRNTPEHPRNIPGTSPEHPRNTPEQPGTTRNNPGTPLEHPIIPRNTLETARNTPGTPKIVVRGQTAHELTKPKTSEDSQFFIRLLRITLRFQSISRMLGIFSKILRTAKKSLINGKNISCT